MRLSPIAALVAVFFASGFVPIPAVGAALPQLALACSSVAAGQPSSCTITRLSGGQGVYVLFKTADGTARAGTDYTATSQLVYLKGGDKTAIVAVPTAINSNATGTLTFNAAISAGVVAVKASGSIVEPAAPPAPIPPPPTPPASDPPLIAGVTQACWNGSIVSVSVSCPAFPAGPHATVIADEQAVPKVDPVHFLPIIYGEDLYRTVRAGETVIVGPSSPDVACVCGGERHQTVVYGLNGKFIGYLWEDNLIRVATAP